jgi:CRISPR/Cas system-associated protein Csm6
VALRRYCSVTVKRVFNKRKHNVEKKTSNVREMAVFEHLFDGFIILFRRLICGII